MQDLGVHHGTVVALGQTGILIQGASGSGKSTLARDLVALGATLVGDDQVLLTELDGTISARAHPELAGRIEIWGYGIVTVPYTPEIEVLGVVDMNRSADKRMPEEISITIGTVALPVFAGHDMYSLASAVLLWSGSLGNARE